MRTSGAGLGFDICGTLTATHTVQDQFVDVTEFVKNYPEAPSFLITQEVRFPGELAYRGEMEILGTASGAANAPQRIYLY